MNDRQELRVPVVPGVRQIIMREQSFVAVSDPAIDARVDTIYELTQIPLPPPHVTSYCSGTRTFTFSGSHRTGADGLAEIHLSRFLDCAPAIIQHLANSNFIGSSPNFTATPETDQPVFLTCTIDVTPLDGQWIGAQGLDVTVKVRGWQHDGQHAPDVAFNWIAIAQTAQRLEV